MNTDIMDRLEQEQKEVEAKAKTIKKGMFKTQEEFMQWCNYSDTLYCLYATECGNKAHNKTIKDLLYTGVLKLDGTVLVLDHDRHLLIHDGSIFEDNALVKYEGTQCVIDVTKALETELKKCGVYGGFALAIKAKMFEVAEYTLSCILFGYANGVKYRSVVV